MIEAIRTSFLPPVVATLFVGESPPAKGGFFYSPERTAFRDYILRALGLADLESFRAAGFYLDDLAHEPVDKLKGAAWAEACRDAREGLKARIAYYRPRAIVVLVKRIEDDVRAAAKAAGSAAVIHVVPFPGNGQQTRFRTAMREIVPGLPRI